MQPLVKPNVSDQALHAALSAVPPFLPLHGQQWTFKDQVLMFK